MAVKKTEEKKVLKKRLPKTLNIGSIYECKNKDGEKYYWICLDIKRPRGDSNDYLYYGFTSIKSENKDDNYGCILNYNDKFCIYYSKENLVEFKELKSPKYFTTLKYNYQTVEPGLSEIYKSVREFKYYDLMNSIQEQDVKLIPYVDVVYDYYQNDTRSCSVVFSYYNSPSTLRGHLILLNNYIECMDFDLKTVLQAFKDGKYKIRGYLEFQQHEEFIISCYTGISKFLDQVWFDDLYRFKS